MLAVLTVCHQQDVADNGAVRLRGDCRGGADKQAAGFVEGGEVEGVGGNLDIGDDAMLLVNGKLQLHPTPVKLGGTLGGEGTPATIFPLVGGEILIQRLHLWTRNYLAEGDL